MTQRRSYQLPVRKPEGPGRSFGGRRLNPIENKVAETIGQTAIQGIPGGYDSADCTITITKPVEHIHGEDR